MECNIAEDIRNKSGPELFRELLRQLPLLGLEDYYKNGIWQDNLMRLDVQLLAHHRMEAGAPELPPLSSIQLPELPAPRPVVPMSQSWGAPRQWEAPARQAWPMTPPAGMVGPGSPGLQQRPPDASAGLRLVSLFVTKWGLDPARTSGLLAKLSPARRNFVMSTFKDILVVRPPGSGGAAVAGQTTTTARLEEYIRTCQEDGTAAAAEAEALAAALADGGAATIINAGAAAVSKAASGGAAPVTIAPPAGAPGFQGGVKRPLEPGMAPVEVPPLLRPKLAEVTTMTKAPTQAVPLALGAQQLAKAKAPSKAAVVVPPVW